MVNPCAKFEVLSFARSRYSRGDTQLTKWGGLWKLEATQGYW